MDHAKSKMHEGVAVTLALAGNNSKPLRILVFEHLADEIATVVVFVVVLVDPLVAEVPRS